MAPQVTVYFHEFSAAASKLGHGGRAGRRISFTIDEAPTICNMVKAKLATKTNKAAVKVIKVGPKKCPSKNALRNARKRTARAFRKKITKERLLEDIEIASRVLLGDVSSKNTMIPRCKIVKMTSSPPINVSVITQIMIGTIPITLPTTELVMMTSIEEDEEILPIVSRNVQQKAKAYENVEEGNNIQFEGSITRARARALAVHSLESSSSLKDTLGGNEYFSQEEIPRVMTQFQRLEINEDPESENMQVLMIGASNIEEQLLEMQRKLAEKEAEMATLVANKEAQIATLAAQLAAQASINNAGERARKETEGESSGSQLTHQDINAIFAEKIREFQMSLTTPILGYRKPYPAHYDTVPFPQGYQKPSFDKFDGLSGSPQEHLAHFYSACGETSQSDPLLVRQFVQSLKGSAFTWYTQLEPGSILTWDDMQRAFLAQFVSSKKKVTLMDLAQTTQRLGESASEFITRWRSLNLQCMEKISEFSAVQICYNNLIPEIATFVGIAEPRTFDELVSKASNVEKQMSRKNVIGKMIQDLENKSDTKNGDNKRMSKKGDSMATFVKVDKKSDNIKRKEETKGTRRLSLKERKEVKYSFDDEDVGTIFDELLAAKMITLPEPKRPAEVNKTDDPKYCRYHRLISHTIEDCYILKDIIQEKINKHEIEVDSSSKHQTATSNMIEGKSTPSAPLPEGAIPVGFHVDNETTVVHAYPGMPRSGNPKIPTLYELMTAPSFDVWEDSSSLKSEDEWQTVNEKKVKKIAKRLSSTKRSKGKLWNEPPSKDGKKKKKNTQRKPKVFQDDEYKQPFRAPITLGDYFPPKLFKSKGGEEEIGNCRTTSCEIHNDDEVDEITLRSGQRIPSADKKEGKEVVDSVKHSDQSSARQVPVITTVEPAVEISVSNTKASTSKRHAKNVLQSQDGKYDIVDHLKRIPSLLSVYDALKMSKELREALITALTNPEVFETNFKFAEVDTTSPKYYACCLASITFDESDLILGDEYHNRPLYVSGLVGDTSINRILLDCGSAVNLLPLRTLRALGMNVRQLTPSMLTIQGFNQVGQKAMGSIALQMEIGELYSDALFHVIDADTSYNILLGRPWLHTYGVVPSTLHQCFKFLVNGEVKKVLADTDPFRGEEVNYADAKFYKQSKVTFSQPTKDEVVQKESQSPTVEKAKPSRLVKIASSKTPKSRKVGLNCSLQDRRESEKKAMEQIQDAFEALMTNYTKPLRKINQSIPGGNLVVSTNLQRNNGQQGRIVSFKRNESSSKVPLKIKAKRCKAKKSAINVTVHQENDMLKAFVSNTKNHEFEGFTDLEKAMLTEE
ncbi:hypothetical protein ACFX12_039014 [Malus domestica]